MKIYVAYKLSGVDFTILKKRLEEVSKVIEELGHKSFIFVRDMQQWKPGGMEPKEIMKKAFDQMKNCDVIISIIETQEKGEGLLIESGMMKGLGKKVIVASGPEGRGFMLKGMADESFDFKDMKEFKEKLARILKK